jgi:OmpA-OmpF porin, OOP family
VQHPKRWWVGLPILAGLIYVATDSLVRGVESDLSQRAAAMLVVVGKGAIDNPGVSVAGRDIIVTGRALSPQGLSTALAALREIKGARVAVDGATLPETVHPYVLTLTRAKNRVTIDGHLPDSGEKATLRADLSRSGLDVEDRSSYGLGAPLGFMELARFAGRELAQLDEGVVIVSDDALSFKGTASQAADYEKLVAALHAPPAGAHIESLAVEPARIAPFVWSAERQGGKIQLKGLAPDTATRERVAAKAKAISGDAEIDDAMRVAAGAPEDFVSAAETALTQLRALDHGKVALKDHALNIEGEGKTNVFAAGLAAEAKQNLPRGFELAAVDVLDGAASPYLFSATTREGGLTISGHAPDEAAIGEIANVAKREFPKLAFTDALTPAKGAPEEFLRAATAGLSALARLTTGGLAISDTTLALTGVAQEGDADAIGDALKAALPKNFGSTIQIAQKTIMGQKANDVSSAADVAGLQRALDAQLEKAPIAFAANKDELLPASAPALAGLAGLLRRSGNATVEIVGHAPEPNIEELRRTIAKRRAEAVAARLVELGVENERVSFSGVVSQKEDPNRPAIEVRVKSF